MIRKNLTIRDDQQVWIKEAKINLSWHVQAMIDELMIRYKKGDEKNVHKNKKNKSRS